MTSYGSELGGLVLAVLDTLYHAGIIHIQYVRFICDNESAVTAAKRPKSDSIFHSTKGEWDLIKTIQDLTVRWCDGITFSFHWAKGHTDLINRPLTRADFLTAMEKGLQHISQETQESTSPPLPFQPTVNPIRNHLRAGFQEQNSIKWTNINKGRLSHT
jgi:hypothetical protein